MSVRVAILALVSLAMPAVAHDVPTVLPNNYVLSDILNQQRIEAAIGTRPATPRRKSTATAPASRVVTSYRSSPVVSARIRRQFIASMSGKVGAANARQLAEALERGDPIANWSQIVAADGLRSGDVADAFAAYWLLNWAMANGREGNRAQVLAVRDQTRSILASNPHHAALSEAQRQEMAETFMLNFLVQHAAYSDAMKRRDQATMRRLGDAAVARFRGEMGLDLRRLQLGGAGFIPTGG
ncbi:DUF6683 family protein [Sphingomonas sp. Root241]|uniref:DUF6683 family protein n=1 Tax=Sphingomonas sp. Root241 TaxID=1736501 RepID=UPI00070050D5|nr:DUF6683 family protein [Sphingomonas sp. Root241]KRC78302.1 hypothetical protein ASE13_18450 [Sphingomonas sp. Root241]